MQACSDGYDIKHDLKDVNVKSGDWISAKQLRNRLGLNVTRECLQNTGLL